MAVASYSDNVFINCPFDDKFKGKFRACVFTILDAGFIPRCSLEVNNAGIFRLQAIVDMIGECKYGVHDISRVQLDARSRLPRFNMPFELGIFHGAKHLALGRHKTKQCLILERDKYRYQTFLSDLAGIDVTPHSDNQKTIIISVRDWLVTASRRRTIPAGLEIVSRFQKFERDFKIVCKKRQRSYSSMPFVELVSNMSDWLRLNQISRQPLFP